MPIGIQQQQIGVLLVGVVVVVVGAATIAVAVAVDADGASIDRNQISIRNIVHFIRCIVSGKSFSLPSGTWTSDTKKRLLILLCTTLALLFARFKVMGSQLPVFTRYVYKLYFVYTYFSACSLF